MKRNVVIMLVLALLMLPACSVIEPLIDGPGDAGSLKEFLQAAEDDYINIRNTAAVNYRNGDLSLDQYNEIRTACCTYSTASNDALKQYAKEKNETLLRAQITKAADELRATTIKIYGGK